MTSVKRFMVIYTAVSGVLALLVGVDSVFAGMKQDAAVGLIVGSVLLVLALLVWKKG